MTYSTSQIPPLYMCRCTVCGGLVKPDIVFFGEALPERFWEVRTTEQQKLEPFISKSLNHLFFWIFFSKRNATVLCLQFTVQQPSCCLAGRGGRPASCGPAAGHGHLAGGPALRLSCRCALLGAPLNRGPVHNPKCTSKPDTNRRTCWWYCAPRWLSRPPHSWSVHAGGATAQRTPVPHADAVQQAAGRRLLED